MTNLLEKMASDIGLDFRELKSNTKTAKLFRTNGVRSSGEFDRIRWLARREDDEARVKQLAKSLTEACRTEWGEMELRPIQALALEQLHDMKGLLGAIRVGGGKTLITMLAGQILDAQRPMLLVPAALRDDAHIAAAQLRQHFNFIEPKIFSYQMLSLDQYKDTLTAYKPDLLICDEADSLKNPKAACTKRVSRYLIAHPKTMFAALSGTLTSRSIKDYAHLSDWALGEHSPLPRSYGTLQEWADALDVDVPENRRLSAGVLAEFMDPQERELAKVDELGAVRRAFQRRVTKSFGVVATGDIQVDCALKINAIEPNYAPAVEEAFEKMARTWETPDGWPIADGASYWRHCRELACGFYYVWDPRPPDEWLGARKVWCSLCRHILSTNRKQLDTEFQVIKAIDDGHITDEVTAQVLQDWRDIRDTFSPNTQARWVDYGVLTLTAEWLQRTGGLAWCEHREFGYRLEQLTGYPYYAEQGRTRSGQRIQQASGPIALSIGSNHKGRNLQDRWCQNLVVSAPPNGRIWEQLIGRTHRDGQQASEVTFEVLCGCLQAWQGFEKARKDARYTQDSMGQNQKLIFADVTWPSLAEVQSRTEARWQPPG